MRLINVRTNQLEEFRSGQIPKYAILSHRWEAEEVSFQDMSNLQTFGNKKGFVKIQSACWLARNKGLQYLWVDTCCIDKTSSSELAEAINSMYRWYQDAEVCFAYLTDIEARKREIKDSVWLTRGWTLQELIAPRNLSFHDRNWVFLGTKTDLAHYLSFNTGIPMDVLLGQSRPSSCSVAQRMSWAAKRETERIEDRAYSLIGLFDVSMPFVYGEGDKSFSRLQEEIIRHSDDQSIFAWDRGNGGTFGGHNGLLASAPSQFVTCQHVVRASQGLPNTGGFQLSNVGLSISMTTLPWTMETYLCILHCGLDNASSDVRLGIFLERLASSGDAEQFARVAFLGHTVLKVSLQAVLQDALKVSRQIHVRPLIFDAPLRRWHGFRLHDLTLPEYAMDEIYRARFNFRDTLQVVNRYSRDEVRTAREYSQDLPLRPVFFTMPRGREDGMIPVRGTSAIIFLPPTKKDKKGERICWLKFGFDEDFAPVCMFGRRNSLWGGTAAHLAVSQRVYDDAESDPGSHALLFRNDWITQLASCTNDRDIAALWQKRDYCVLKGHRDRGFVAEIAFLRVRISVQLEPVHPNYTAFGKPENLQMGMNVWTVNVGALRGDGRNGLGRTAQSTGELLLRGVDDLFLAL
jgi:hypothetical protein